MLPSALHLILPKQTPDADKLVLGSYMSSKAVLLRLQLRGAHVVTTAGPKNQQFLKVGWLAMLPHACHLHSHLVLC